MSSFSSNIRRIILIQKLIQSKGSSLAELQEYIQNHPESDGKEYSERTFFRDINTLRTSYKIDIDYDRKRNVYHITTPTDELNIRMLESFEMLNVLIGEKNFSEYIHFENRRSQGIQYFQRLLQAIKDHKLVKFKYQKFYEDNITDRLIEPYALKEFNGRWYLLSKDHKDDKIKTFGLDKMSQVECKPGKFTYPTDFDPNAMFKNCFGIHTPNPGEQIQEVILLFNHEQGKYVKSYKLHESQKELQCSDDEYTIALNIYITHDFIMEILSYGDDVEVIEPESLKEEIIKRYKKAISQY